MDTPCDVWKSLERTTGFLGGLRLVGREETGIQGGRTARQGPGVGRQRTSLPFRSPLSRKIVQEEVEGQGSGVGIAGFKS